MGGAVNDYPYCDYGAVPQGTPATFDDNPSLVTFDSWPGGTSRTVSVGYLALQMGPSQPAELPDSTINTALTRINDDLRYIVGTLGMHLPSWTDQYYLDYFLLGSGLPGDNTPTTNTPESGYSGWQGGHPDVESTYHAMTRDANRWNITHEFVHVLQNGYGTIAGELASWVHEAHNDYIILRLQQYVNGTIGSASTVGWLDPLVLEGSYLPIESCGMLADGSAVGPNQYMERNWEGDFGGYRYSCLFPLFVSQRVDPGFFNALWEQATSSETVLQTMIRLIGADAVKCMVQEYGARNAIGDYLEFSSDLQRQTSVGSGSWFYTDTVDQGGWLVPSDPVRLPRHTGRNNIPISVDSGATEVTVEFAPDAAGSAGSSSELAAQIVYRATDGSAVFSPPVTSGTTSVSLTLPPANDVVIVVVTNVKLDGYDNAESYGWDPHETFGYQIRVTGGTPAPTNVKYF